MMQPQVDTATTRLLRLAAVSGAFDPAALAKAAAGGDMAALAAECDEDIAGKSYRWRLRAGPRRRVLNGFENLAGLKAALVAAPQPQPDDPFGVALAQALAGRRRPRRAAAAGTAHANHAALSFALDMPVLAARRDAITAEMAALTDLIARRERDRALDVVLPAGTRLFGRQESVRAIADFARGKASDAPVGAQPLVLSGIGGIGKSAMIAQLLREAGQARDWSAILLDFDRPALLNAEPFEIVREILRQLATISLPAGQMEPSRASLIRSTLNDLRRELVSRTLPLTSGGGRAEVVQVEPEFQLSQLETLAYPTLAGLDAQFRSRPVLVVMDTFELVTGLSQDVVGRVLALEETLRSKARLTGLRTLLAGRSLDDALRAFASKLAPQSAWISIRGLDARSGAALIRAEDKAGRIAAPALRRKASAALKGHPLALKIFARYCQDQSPGEIAAFVSDMAADSDFAAEFAQRFLYTRILDRIPDQDLRALAHPGLVLRHVTPALIRLVLAVPCGIGPVDPARSRKLFNRLAANHWLVTEAGPGRVRHLPELRQHMLAAMLARGRADEPEERRARKADLAARARAVSLAARDYYLAGPAPSDPAFDEWQQLTPAERHVEALYHTALIDPAPARMARDDAIALQTGIGEDFTSLPVDWRALVKAETGNFAALSDSERQTLSGALREKAEGQHISTLEKAGAYDAVSDAAAHETVRRADERASMAAMPADPAGSRPIGGDFLALPPEVAPPEAARPRFAPAAPEPISAETAPPGAPQTSLTDADLDLAAQSARAAFMQGDIAKAAEVATPLIEAFFAGAEYFKRDPRKHLSVDGAFWQSGLWLGALAVASRSKPVIPFFVSGLTGNYPLPSIIIQSLLNAINKERLFEDETSVVQITFTEKIWRAKVNRYIYAMLASVYSHTIEMYLNGARLHVDDQALLWPEFFGVAQSAISFEHGPGRNRAGPVFGLKKKSTLWSIEELYKEAQSFMLAPAALRLTPGEKAKLLRGLTPELHTPAAAMLAKMPPEDAARFVDGLAALAPNWPIDLVFGRGPGETGSARFARADATTVVVTADRCAILPDLLHRLASFDPRAGDLLRVHETITRRFFDWG